MKPSKRFDLNKEDLNKWINNSLVFFAPALLVFLIQIQAGKDINESLVAVKLWVLNTLIDLLRKFISGK